MATKHGRCYRRRAAVAFLAAGLGALGWVSAASASATVTLSVSPSTGLANGQSVTLSASGLADGSSGNVLECNNATGEPTVALGTPVNSDVAVGCTAPALAASALASTSSTGTLSKTYSVSTGTIGPPCGGANDLVATCPSTDSSGGNPSTDAAAYPCPPTPAQQAAGVTCVIHFGDQAGDLATGTILFQGESAPTTTAAPSTTAAAIVSTTAAPSTGSLASTGAGPALWWVALVALSCIALGLLLLLPSPAWRRTRSISGS